MHNVFSTGSLYSTRSNLSTAFLYISAVANFNYFQLLVQTIAQQLSQLIVRNDSTLLNLSQRHSIMVFPCGALSLGKFQLARPLHVGFIFILYVSAEARRL